LLDDGPVAGPSRWRTISVGFANPVIGDNDEVDASEGIETTAGDGEGERPDSAKKARSAVRVRAKAQFPSELAKDGGLGRQ
jgi:hypothetical protein